MKIKLIQSIFFISLIPFFISAQDFDESFLQSLPEDIKTDLLDRASEKDDLEETQYRRPSTFINKPDLDDDEESKRYGSKIFNMMQSTLMPLNEPNFNGDYILDYGDDLELQLVGQKASISKLQIKRDGSINIPDIGKVYLAGLSLDEGVELIKNKIKTSMIGVNAFISLINVRDIQVIVAGNVFNPGPYTLNGNSNVFHALSVSGGPSDEGSFRLIDLIRGDQIVESIDLYQTFIYGKSDFKKRLRSGDIIFVRPVKNIVSVEGAVKRQGLYELKEDENLSEALFFANGIQSNADLSDITLMRALNGSINKIDVKNIQDLKYIQSRDSDRINIRRFPLRGVEIFGAVKNPGSYLISEGDGILKVVMQAGGYSDNAYPYGGILENNTTREINKLALEKLYKNFLDTIIMSSSQSNEDSSQISTILAELKNTPPSGRVSTEFDIEILKENPELDIKLQDGDKITIPEYLDQVYIFGEVSSEGTVRYVEDKDLSYFLNSKGGLTEYADKKSIYVLHPNGVTVKANSKNVFAQNRKKVEIYPGSIIFIPRKVNNSYLVTQTAQAYAAILGNIGVSLASISVLKN